MLILGFIKLYKSINLKTGKQISSFQIVVANSQHTIIIVGITMNEHIIINYYLLIPFLSSLEIERPLVS
jgi:hypothetical protein